MTNRESVGLQNDIKRLCQHWVQQHYPEVYEQFQQALGVKPKSLDPRLQAIIDQIDKEVARK